MGLGGYIVILLLHADAPKQDVKFLSVDLQGDVTVRAIRILTEEQHATFLLAIHPFPQGGSVAAGGADDEVGGFWAFLMCGHPHLRHYHPYGFHCSLVGVWHPYMCRAQQVEQSDCQSGVSQSSTVSVIFEFEILVAVEAVAAVGTYALLHDAER